MPDYFREQPKLRLAVGAAITVLVWVLYIVRIALGVGPMHDHEGHQAPTFHYLAGALTVTGMVAVWITARAIITHKDERKSRRNGRHDK